MTKNSTAKSKVRTIEKLNPKVDGSSLDILETNFETMRSLFPEVFAEGSNGDGPRWKVDLEKLGELLGEFVEDKPERFNFNWHGKSKAKRIAQTPSTGTLRPCPDESVNWDTTKNIFIEGDNLEVLKLLQKSYHKRVKMIYIDPPYNTGDDLIYPDKFQDNLDTYLRYTGQVDGEGLKLSPNIETSGRFHTNWLNMMYSRLKLASNLLADDGLICISISDIELANLRLLMNEIFGEENYVNIVNVEAKVSAGASGGGEDKRLKKNIEYIVIYSKRSECLNTLSHLYTSEPLMDVISRMKLEGESWKYTSVMVAANERVHFRTIEDGDGNPIKIFKRSGLKRSTIRQACKDENFTEEEAYVKYFDSIFSDTNAQTSIRTRVMDVVGNLEKDEILEVEYVPRSGKDKGVLVTHSYISNTVRRVIWLRDVAEKDGDSVIKRSKLGTLWDHFDYNNVGKEGGIPFPEGKKPVDLLRTCIQLYKQTNGLFLDFFAGSGSFCHAVMAQNAEDGGDRRFIAIQLPERINDRKDTYKQLIQFCVSEGIEPTVSAISRERIKRSAGSLNSANSLDLGFKAFQLDDSCIVAWDGNSNDVSKDLLKNVEHIKEGRSESDIVFELLIKLGIDLTTVVERRNIEPAQLFIIAAGALVVCLSDKVSLGCVEGIASLKDELQPELMRVVFRDSGFSGDVMKTNALQILRQRGIDDVKTL